MTIKKKINKRMILVVMMLTTILSGCWDMRESERMLYLYGIGVDYKDGQYDIYAQIINFANIAKSESPPSPDIVQSEVGHATGQTINEAFYKLYTSLDEELYWGHLTYFVFSEDALKEGRMNYIVNWFVRFHNTRYQTWMYSTKEPVKDVLLTTPILNKALSLSKLSDPVNSYKQSSFIEPVTFRELTIRLDEPSHEVNIPLVSFAQNWDTEKESNKATAVDGVSIVSPDSLRGTISEDKVKGLQWMTDKTIRAGFTIKSEANESTNRKKLSIVLQKVKVKVNPVVNNRHVTFNVDFEAVATVSGFQGKITEDEVRRAIHQKVEKDIRETYQEGLNINADIYRLSEYLYRKDVKSWKALQKDGKVELKEDSIGNINVTITKLNSGRIIFKDTIR